MLYFHPDPLTYNTCGTFESGFYQGTLDGFQQQYHSVIWSTCGKNGTSVTYSIFQTFPICEKHHHNKEMGHNQAFFAIAQNGHSCSILPWIHLVHVLGFKKAHPIIVKIQHQKLLH